jgi:hypothetical protein
VFAGYHNIHSEAGIVQTAQKFAGCLHKDLRPVSN